MESGLEDVEMKESFRNIIGGKRSAFANVNKKGSITKYSQILKMFKFPKLRY